MLLPWLTTNRGQLRVSSSLVGALTRRNRADPSGWSTYTPSRNGMWSGACLGVKNIGKPCTGKPYARFDEGGLATMVTEGLLRHRQTKGADTDRSYRRRSVRPLSTLPYPCREDYSLNRVSVMDGHDQAAAVPFCRPVNIKSLR